MRPALYASAVVLGLALSALWADHRTSATTPPSCGCGRPCAGPPCAGCCFPLPCICGTDVTAPITTPCSHNDFTARR